jgi:hypothetical protein
MSSNYYNNITGIVVNDPTKVIHGPSNHTIQTGQGLWSQIQQGSKGNYNAGIDLFETEIVKLQKQLDDQALTIKLMRLKILGIEGKFTQEEISNIKKMLMSEDEASRTLADSIIENA